MDLQYGPVYMRHNAFNEPACTVCNNNMLYESELQFLNYFQKYLL